MKWQDDINIEPKRTLVRKKLIQQVVTKYEDAERQFQEMRRHADHSY